MSINGKEKESRALGTRCETDKDEPELIKENRYDNTDRLLSSMLTHIETV